jgi:hypothetical protein
MTNSTPILTIVTRHWVTPEREESFRKCCESIQHLIEAEQVQHLVTYDTVGLGWKGSCQLVVDKREEALGDYVWFLDDDDTLECRDLPDKLIKIKRFDDPDIIIARAQLRQMLIPVDKLWIKKNFRVLQINQCGLPNFIMKNWVFQEYIHNVALRNEYNHDFDIMKAWQRDDGEKHFKVYYMGDVLVKQRVQEGKEGADRHQKERMMIKIRTERMANGK